jgi:hypothetical protein
MVLPTIPHLLKRHAVRAAFVIGVLLATPVLALECKDQQYQARAVRLHIVAIDGERTDGSETLILRNRCHWTWRGTDGQYGWDSEEKVFVFFSATGVAPWGGKAQFDNDRNFHFYQRTPYGKVRHYLVAPYDNSDQPPHACPLWPVC